MRHGRLWRRSIPILAAVLLGCGKGEVQIRAGDPQEGFLAGETIPERVPPASPAGEGRFSVWLEDRNWDFRPWLQDFKQRLFAVWESPAAYRSGEISGWTELMVTVVRDGTILDQETVGEEGPSSLGDASRRAVSGVGRCLRLPADCSPDTLKMRLRLHYPAMTQ